MTGDAEAGLYQQISLVWANGDVFRQICPEELALAQLLKLEVASPTTHLRSLRRDEESSEYS